ncbi:hypothetical protein Cs7R123_63800 [Catellatospora sp. TT07R-123]|uniref:hypothetical protein n=1 Tax=Catellatospora sp. TT07R-123 TaxID=2733863 RepID=UPI001B225BE8|nr:hypothetical protein [Catellatospora sp. TT07R-123]GHJ49038.1 hypothetical protein Cs7R123_63800 [Catellatospora sp. TT07R-123]
MDEATAPVEDADRPATERVEVSRRVTADGRTITVHATGDGQRVRVQLAIQDAEGNEAGRLNGEIALADMTQAGQTLAALIGSVAVAVGQAKPSLGLDQLRQRHPNAYRPWTDEADALLTERFQAGAPLVDLAGEFGRKTSAIVARLVRLGLLPPDHPQTDAQLAAYLPTAARDDKVDWI